MEKNTKLTSKEQDIPQDQAKLKQTTLDAFLFQKKTTKLQEKQQSNDAMQIEEFKIDDPKQALGKAEEYKETEENSNVSTNSSDFDVDQKIRSLQSAKSYKKIYILPHKSSKWPLIKSKLESLATGLVKENEFYSVLDDLIALHLKGVNQKNNFSLLKTAIASFSNFFDEVLPFMASVALKVDSLFPEDIPLLYQYEKRILFLSKAQSACLLFHMFFCTTINQNNQILPSPCTLAGWYNGVGPRDSSRTAKLRCFLNYARQMKNNLPELEKISIERTSLASGVEYGINYWAGSTEPLSEVVMKEGSIQEAHGSLQIDFANKYLGGGVLNTGCVQEEIMFSVAPEHLCSLLVTECLAPQEAAIIKGAQEYSKFTGYGDEFKYAGDFQGEIQPLDKFMRRDIITVAIDAMNFRTTDVKKQFQIESILREMNKALAGFQGSIQERNEKTDVSRVVATGRWGCGAFRGDPQLKFIVQWLACSKAQRKMVFYPFGDKSLSAAADLVQYYQKRSIGELFQLVLSFVKDVKGEREEKLFEYLLSY